MEKSVKKMVVSIPYRHSKNQLKNEKIELEAKLFQFLIGTLKTMKKF